MPGILPLPVVRRARRDRRAWNGARGAAPGAGTRAAPLGSRVARATDRAPGHVARGRRERRRAWPLSLGGIRSDSNARGVVSRAVIPECGWLLRGSAEIEALAAPYRNGMA